MEPPHDDHFLGDADNQGVGFSETDFAAIHSSEESVGTGVIDYDSPEAVNEVAPAALDQNPNLPTRKVHSAAPTSTEFGRGGRYEDMPRPYTSAGFDDPPSPRSQMTQHRTKKYSALRKKTAKAGETTDQERPRSADVNEWGDFDTDRLLREDFEQHADQSNQTLDPLDGQRTRSRKSRRATPATASPRPNPWEGYLYLNGDSKECAKPPMQVLRQKPIEILNLDFVAQTNQPSRRASTTPKPLLGRASLERLASSHPRPTTSCASFRPTTPTPLFGTEILATPSNRAAIFARFVNLWSLISPRSTSPPTDPPGDSVGPGGVETRSPFECSMAMVKICKAVGISLTPSAATRLSFWYIHENGVDFESFCDLVIQGAVQPALHHFNLDNSIDEYVSALDTIVQSLVTTAPARRHKKDKLALSNCPVRVKELDEIEPVFLSWKAGITPPFMQPTEDPGPPPTRASVTAEKVRRALEASASQRMMARQLPSEEARVTHVENIRRKVQLHKSWKFSSDGNVDDRRANSPNTPVSRDGLASSHENQTAASRAAELSAMFEHAHSMVSTSAGVASAGSLPQQDRDELEHVVEQFKPTDAKELIPENEAGAENDQVLVCCSCSVRSAVLWCASCFTVNCQKCWQEVHSCTVDMSMVSSTSSLAKKPLLGPTTLAIQKKRCGSATLRPPVAMIYLPTKAIIPGTIAKGNPIVRHRRSSIEAATKDEVPAIVANAILPSLHKSRSDSKIPRRLERPQVEDMTPTTDSTVDLLKSLMLRMAPTTPTPESRTTGSHTSMELATRLQKHHTPLRPKLHLAPVSFDAELLLSHTPDRRS